MPDPLHVTPSRSRNRGTALIEFVLSLPLLLILVFGTIDFGHLVQVITLRRLQLAGNRPLALVGGATGLIGDPRPTAERTLHSRETVQEWVANLRRQIQPFLEFEGEYYDNGLGDPGSYTNPYRFHPRADAAEDDGFDGFGAFDDGDEP